MDDQDFFRKFAECYPSLVEYFKIMIPCDEQRAKDLASETMEKAHDRSGEYDPAIAGFPTWVKAMIGRSLVSREWKRKGRMVYLQSSDDSDEPSDRGFIDEDAPPPDHAALSDEMHSLKHQAYLKLMKVLWLCGGYPHQQIAFAYSRLIYGQKTPRGIDGSPQRLEREHKDDNLLFLVGQFKEKYLSEFGPADPDCISEIGESIEQLHHRLSETVASLTKMDSASFNLYKPLHPQTVGYTCLRQYWEGRQASSSKAITDWSKGVEQSVRRRLGIAGYYEQEDILGDQGSIESSESCPSSIRIHCKLRHLPPCCVDSDGARTRSNINKRVSDTAPEPRMSLARSPLLTPIGCSASSNKDDGMDHLSDELINKYITDGMTGADLLEADTHLGECAGCREKVRAHVFLCENFDSIWNGWTAEEHGRAYNEWRTRHALNLAAEGSPALVERVRLWLEQVGEGVEVGLCVLLDSVKRVATVAAAELPGGYDFALVPLYSGIGESEASVKITEDLRRSSDMLEKGETEKAIDALLAAAQIDSRMPETAVTNISVDGRVVLQITADARRKRVWAKYTKQEQSPAPELALLLSLSGDKAAMIAEFKPVIGEDTLLAEWKDVGDGPFSLRVLFPKNLS